MDTQPTTTSSVMKEHSQARQYLACGIVNILSFMTGASYGWVTPMLPVLQSKNSPVDIPPISDMDASWLVSINNLTRILSIPAYNYFMQRFGHKATGLLIAVLFLINWMMFLFANSMSVLFCGRLISGVAFAGVLLLVPSYTIDITEDNIKGRLGVLFAMSMNLGCTFTFIMGFYTSYIVFHLTNTLVPIVFIVAFFRMPESPLFLAIEGKNEKANEALRWLRNGKENLLEIDRLHERAKDVLEKRKQKISFRIITERCTWRALLICTGLICNQQCCGTQPIIFYILTIFQESGTTIPANVASILIGILLSIGSALASLTTEKYGRRSLLMFSNITMTVCLFVLGIYLYLREVGWDLRAVGWLPFVCLSMYILGNGVGVLPLPFTIIAEMVSPQARNLVQGVCVALSSIVAFFVTFVFMPTVKIVGYHGCFLLYGLVCVVSTVCIFLTVPETKNRSIEDVVKHLKRDDYVRSVLHGDVTTPEDVKLRSPE